MKFKITTCSGVTQEVELDHIEVSLISNKIWEAYEKSESPALARAHLLLTSLFFGKVEIVNEEEK